MSQSQSVFPLSPAQALRSAFFGVHWALARRMSAPLDRPGEAPIPPTSAKPRPEAIQRAYLDVFAQDRANIAANLYRAPRELDMRDLPKMAAQSRAFLADVPEVDRRRVEKAGTEARDIPGSDKYPAYYRQNFHWQSGGWLTAASASLYDFQVEALFGGTAAAMRRTTALALLAESLEGLDQRRIAALDLGCGTGSFAAQIMQTFPRLNLTAMDLSPAYADHARKNVAPWSSADVLTGQAEAIPFPDSSFDRIVCVYLFHELPPKIRRAVLSEVARVLKPGGVFILADALQAGDNSDMDMMLEYFPIGFHEPYFNSWLKTDIRALAKGLGLIAGGHKQALLTKAIAFKRC